MTAAPALSPTSPTSPSCPLQALGDSTVPGLASSASWCQQSKRMPLPQPCQRLPVQTGEGTRQLQREWRCVQAAGGTEQSLSSDQDHRKPDGWEPVIGLLWRPKCHQSVEGSCLWSHRSTALRIMLASHPWKALERGLGTTKAGWGRERKK